MMLFFDLFTTQLTRIKGLSELELRNKMARLNELGQNRYKSGNRILMR